MTLIENWRCAWRFWSVRIQTIGIFLEGLFLAHAELPLQLWAMMPGEVKAILPAWAVRAVPLVAFVAATVARIVRQEKLRGK